MAFSRCHSSPTVTACAGGEFCKDASASLGNPRVVPRGTLTDITHPRAETSLGTSLCLNFVLEKLPVLPQLPQWGWEPF